MTYAAPILKAEPDAAPGLGKSSANRAWLRALEMTARLDQAPQRLLAHVVEDWALTQPDAPALLSDACSLTYGELAARSRQYARWALAQGLGKGDVVALLALNSPDYMAIWLGLSRVGVVTALINTHLRGAALAHCIAVAAPRLVLTAQSLATDLGQALSAHADAPVLIPLTGEGGLDAQRDQMNDAPLGEDEEGAVTLSDPALLIYTSGTTGLPKAARVSHHRVMSWSGWFAGLTNAQPSDRLYDCLPMYHSVGGVVATGALLTGGGSVVLREKFSAAQFWDDVARWDCTLAQYIGELCRYLLAAPTHPAETGHRLRMVLGNGLSGDVWSAFQARFQIPQILEFYAATEGNFSLYNVEGEPGAIGRIPGFMAHRFPAALVRFDPETGQPARDEEGRCIRCESGEAIGRINAAGDPAHRFEGYTSHDDSERKVLRDVFAPGDAWLRTGDLMRVDARGFYYFIDRVGDTFRWKGENVATTEVAQVLCEAPGVVQACVYGVEIPGCDGRAGMAALVVKDGFQLATLSAHLAHRLPAYARPVILRLTRDLAMTETFKQKKTELADQAYDPAVVTDPLYIAQSGGYERLDGAMFKTLSAGMLRV